MRSTFELYQNSEVRDHFAGMSERMIELVKTVLDHADAHYNDGGWDVIAECWEPSLIASYLAATMTEDDAIDSFRPAVAVWADREADARNSTF